MLTRALALGDPWTQDHADRVAAVFDDLAEEWSARNIDDTKAAPVRDAFERGDVPTEGAWLELGSGTGAGTRILSGIVGSLIATDLSAEMLHHAPPELAPRVRADASMLPYRDRSFDAVLMINMLLFPHEVERVLRNAGTVLWVNTLGDQTPIHLPPATCSPRCPATGPGAPQSAGTGFWLTATRA